MESKPEFKIPIGTKALILSKLYYGVLSKQLENIDVERYFSVLHHIYANNGVCCQQNICNSLAIDKTAMVKVLDYLTKAGFIERKVNPNDRREHFIHLSKKGEKQTKDIVQSFEWLDYKMFENVSDVDQVTFNKVMVQLMENLKTMPADDLLFNYKKTKTKKKK